ncbi:MAG: hypothetical protein P1P89_15630 [Desulfobacterales bacterium]|nr:hypothetical protein [Desulfobacterales bacterium]
MKDIITLLKPRIWSFKNPIKLKTDKGQLIKILIFGVLGAFFWGGIFILSYRILRYFKGVEGFGDLLAYKLLSMILVTFFSLLIFSSILTFLSKLYLSRDLALVHSMPVSSYKIFLARWIESTIDSSWMVIVYTLPVFLAYGIVFQVTPFYFLIFALTIVALSLIASVISSFLVMLAVMLVPASRIRSIFVFLGIALFLILFLAFRLLRPERLVDPEAFASVLVYLNTLRTPASPFLPSTWAYDSIRAALTGETMTALFHTTLSWSGALVLIFLNVIMADAVYFKGLSKTQTAAMRFFKFNGSRGRFLAFLPDPIHALTVKEVKTFLRDQTQWSQLFLIAALVIIYIYNFKVLPLEKSPIQTVYLQNLLSFLNMGLASFVLIAIAARFAYPAVSTEGEAFWLIKSAPVTLKAFLWIKFTIYFVPLLFLSEIITVATNILLNVTPFMMALSTITMFFIVPGVVSMGIGLGAAYADFNSENPTQTVTSFGGFLFMALSAGFISTVIVLEASPVYSLFMADLRKQALTPFEWFWIVGSFVLVLIICVLATVLPMKFGEKRLSNLPL